MIYIFRNASFVSESVVVLTDICQYDGLYRYSIVDLLHLYSFIMSLSTMPNIMRLRIYTFDAAQIRPEYTGQKKVRDQN